MTVTVTDGVTDVMGVPRCALKELCCFVGHTLATVDAAVLPQSATVDIVGSVLPLLTTLYWAQNCH